MESTILTHNVINDLAARGFSAQQAEAVVEWQIKIAEAILPKKSENLDLKKLEQRLTFKFFMLQAGSIVLLATIMKLIL